MPLQACNGTALPFIICMVTWGGYVAYIGQMRERLYNLGPIIDGESEVRSHLENTRVQAKIILKGIISQELMIMCTGLIRLR